MARLACCVPFLEHKVRPKAAAAGPRIECRTVPDTLGTSKERLLKPITSQAPHRRTRNPASAEGLAAPGLKQNPARDPVVAAELAPMLRWRSKLIGSGGLWRKLPDGHSGWFKGRAATLTGYCMGFI